MPLKKRKPKEAITLKKKYYNENQKNNPAIRQEMTIFICCINTYF